MVYFLLPSSTVIGEEDLLWIRHMQGVQMLEIELALGKSSYTFTLLQ